MQFDKIAKPTIFELEYYDQMIIIVIVGQKHRFIYMNATS